MPTRAEVLASKIQQYDAQITNDQNADIDDAIAKLATAQLASGAIGGGVGEGGGTGDASAANQVTGNNSLSSINTKLPALGQATPAASTPVVLPATQITALTPPSNTGYALDATVNSLLKPESTLAEVTTLGSITNPLPVGTNSIGQVTVNAGTDLNTSLLALESGGNLASINTKIPTQGQALEAASTPVVLPAAQITTLTPPSNTDYSTATLQGTGNTSLTSIDTKTPSPDKIIVLGFTTVVAVNTNLLDSTGAGAATDVRTYGMADIYVTATTSTGLLAFQGSLNAGFTESVANVPYLDLTLNNTSLASLATVAGIRRYQVNLTGVNYFRINSTTPAAGTRVTAVFRTSSFTPSQNNVTIAPNQSVVVSSAQSASPGPTVADISSSVLSVSATTAGFTPTWGLSNIFTIQVSAVTLAPTLDITVQESPDGGLTYRTCYVFPRITAIGTYSSPLIACSGRQYRYVQTLGGTGTVTRVIGRSQSNLAATVGASTFVGAAVLSTVSQFALPPGNKVRSIYFTNNTASLVYLQIHESAAALTGTSVPLIPSIRVEANSTRILTQADLGTFGTVFGPNTRVGLSSSFGVYTAALIGDLPNMGLVIDTITF